MTPTHGQRLRLIDVLQRQKDRWGSYDQLSREIESASNGVIVDRRKLKNLVDGMNISLRINELRALDDYLAPLGEGLAANPIFEQSTILAEIARGTEVTFILGSFPREELDRIDISHWDVRSMIELLRNLNHYGRIQIDIEEVIYRDDDGATDHTFEDENWRQGPKSERASVISVGSSRVNRATEVVLAEMFNVTPFQAPQAIDQPLPFYFAWPKDRPNFVSRFELDGPSIERADPKLAKEIASGDSNAMGMSVNGRMLSARRGKGIEDWLTYGVIAVQRRYTGRIWLVLAGLSGLSTFGAARATETIVQALPHAETGRNSDVLWAVVETAVETDPEIPGDQRIVRGQQIIHGPEFWRVDPEPEG